ncbi:MAG: META domain-containing protein [Muribaculaceae bacterium]|nr:META domain-containing protein [Muribaculaceae bacterium]
MKNRNNVMITALGLAMLLGASSCSIFKPSNDSEGSGKGLQGWIESGKEETKTISDNTKKEAKKVEKKTDNAISDVREKLEEIANSQANGTLNGDWAIESVLGKKAVGETAPFIKFVPEQNRIYGNNGCNIINGFFKSSYADKTISFNQLATTMMLCGDGNITDAEIGEALGLTVRYTMENGKDSESILKFYDAGGREVMQLMHRDFHFLDGTWAVETIDGETVNIKDMKIALDVDEKKMHGNTGCNIINGELETDMDAANSISFSKIAMTRMACPNSGWETRMTMALEEAVTAEKISADEIAFLGSNGQQVMRLKKTSPIED